MGEGPGKWWRDGAFRFGFAYWALFIFPFPLSSIPYVASAAEVYLSARGALVHAVGAKLHVPIPEGSPSGSGDSTADWVWMGCNLAMALLAAVVWSLGARKPPSPRTKAAFSVGLRYFLAATILGYGAVKIAKTQFPSLAPSMLATTYGDSSPMGLLWRFMGHSTAYSIFTGVLEVGGALLLFHRRTVTLGALILAGVMANVVMLNLCFDVPVKIFSTHLLVIALLLLAPQARALARLFFLGRPAELVLPPSFEVLSRRGRIVRLVAKSTLVAGFVLVSTVSTAMAYTKWGDGRPPLPLEGIWQVVELTHGDEGASKPEPLRWQRVTIDMQGFVTFDTDGMRRRWEQAYDPEGRTLRLKEKGGGALATEDGTTPPDADRLELSGEVAGKATRVVLRKVPDSEVLLKSRGFHWVNEQPFWR
jgi:hypothetical protein